MEQHETEAALLPNIANQMRSLLSNLYLAASQVIPPEQREQDPAALLLFAAFLFFSYLKLHFHETTDKRTIVTADSRIYRKPFLYAGADGTL